MHSFGGKKRDRKPRIPGGGQSSRRREASSPRDRCWSPNLWFRIFLLFVLGLTGGFVYVTLSAGNALPACARDPVRTAAGDDGFHAQGGSKEGRSIVPDSVGGSYGNHLIALGETFLGTPYVGGTLEGEGEEQVVVNLEEMDCTTFVEYVLALAAAGVQPDEVSLFRAFFKEEQEAVSKGCPHGDVYTGGEGVGAVEATTAGEVPVDAQRRALFLQELEQYRYRGGRCMGYLSRLHYFSEWLLDNEQRGRLQILRNLPGAEPLPLELNFMSTHSHLYSRLEGESALVDSLRVLEQNLATTTLSYLPNSEIATAEAHLQEGDIIAFVTEVKGLDVSHTGLATFHQNRLFLLHASTRRHKVERSPQALSDYVLGMKGVKGILVARPLAPKKTQRNFGQSK